MPSKHSQTTPTRTAGHTQIGTALSGTEYDHRLPRGGSGQAQGSEIAVSKVAMLPSTRDDPERDRRIKDVIRGPISAMTALHLLGEREKTEAWRFWVDSLKPYPPNWIEDAFKFFARNGGGRYPNPQNIIEIINKRRGG